MWVGTTQVLRWEYVFMFVGAKSSLRSVLSVSRALLTPCCSTPLFPKFYIVGLFVVGLFLDTQCHLSRFGEDLGGLP